MTPEENLARITEEVNEQMRRFGYILPETNQKLLEAQTGIQNFGFKVQLATNIMGNLTDAVGDYTKAMYRGEKGAAAFNSSITSMSNAAQAVAVGLSLLVPGGKIIKGLTAGLTYITTELFKQGAKLTEAANEQGDKMYDAFSQLAESGAVGSDGIEGLFKDVQKLGLNVLKLDKFMELAGQNANELARMGGTVSRGRKQFADLGLEMRQYEVGLRKLGLNENEQAEAILEYAKMQNRLTFGQETNFGNLASSANRYIREQDTLTKVTGLSRKQQQNALDKAMSNQRYAATIDALTRQEKHKEVEQLRRRMLIAESMGQGQGFQDIVSGNLQTEASRQYFQLTQGEGLREAEEIKEGRFRDDEEAFRQSIQRTLEAGGRTFREQGSLGKVGVFDQLYGAYSDAAKMEQARQRNMAETMRLADQETTAQANAAGTAAAAQSELLKAQNDSMLALQAFVQTGIPNLARNTMVSVAEEFNKLVVRLREKLGSGPIVGNLADRNARDPLSESGTLGIPRKPSIESTNNRTASGPLIRENNKPNEKPKPPNEKPEPPNSDPVVVIQPAPEKPPPSREAQGPLQKETRAHGTSGEIGSLFEPKDIIAQLHKGERVLNKDENADLTKLFDMVRGEKSQKKMIDVQDEMLKIINRITGDLNVSGAFSKEMPASVKEKLENLSMDYPAQNANAPLKGSQASQDALKAAMSAAASSQSALLGNMPKLEIDKEMATQIGQTIKESMGEEFKSAVDSINRLAEQMQNRSDTGLQQQMVGLLEEMRRSMQSTAKASERLAQVASN